MSDYSFKLENVFNYNYDLIYSDEVGTVSAIIEYLPCEDSSIAVWEADFELSPERKELMLKRLEEWAKQNRIKITLYRNRKRSSGSAKI